MQNRRISGLENTGTVRTNTLTGTTGSSSSHLRWYIQVDTTRISFPEFLVWHL